MQFVKMWFQPPPTRLSRVKRIGGVNNATQYDQNEIKTSNRNIVHQLDKVF